MTPLTPVQICSLNHCPPSPLKRANSKNTSIFLQGRVAKGQTKHSLYIDLIQESIESGSYWHRACFMGVSLEVTGLNVSTIFKKSKLVAHDISIANVLECA